MAQPVAGLYARVRHLVPELAKFGVVGGIGTVVDLGGAAVLQYHVGPLKAKAVSITAATIITYVGSRFWTFRHRENQPVHREAVLFFVLNVIGLGIAEAVIALTTYGLGMKGPLAYNAASFFGTGLGTIFRFYAYRKWVFLAPAEEAPALVPAAAVLHDLDCPPWELDPAFLDRPTEHSRQAPLDNSFIPNERVAPPLVTAAAPVRESPTLEIPALEGPAWQGPALEDTAPVIRVRENPAWEAPTAEIAPWGGTAWETPEPEIAAPGVAAWENLSWESPAPETPSWEAPAPEIRAWEAPAPKTPAWEALAPKTPAWQAPAPKTPAWQAPAPKTPAWQAPAPKTPAWENPALENRGLEASERGAPRPVSSSAQPVAASPRAPGRHRKGR
jgi:putative flippase GtrA